MRNKKAMRQSHCCTLIQRARWEQLLSQVRHLVANFGTLLQRANTKLSTWRVCRRWIWVTGIQWRMSEVCFQTVTSRMWCSSVILDLLALVSVSLSRVLILKPSALPVWVPWSVTSHNDRWHHRASTCAFCFLLIQMTDIHYIITCEKSYFLFEFWDFLILFLQTWRTTAGCWFGSYSRWLGESPLLYQYKQYMYSVCVVWRFSHSWESSRHSGWVCRSWADECSPSHLNTTQRNKLQEGGGTADRTNSEAQSDQLTGTTGFIFVQREEAEMQRPSLFRAIVQTHNIRSEDFVRI